MAATHSTAGLTMASLQDQLLKAGVVDKKKVNQVKHQKHKATKQQPKGKPRVDEVKEAAAQALAEKAARDREINQDRQREAEKKAIRAQIVQLVEMNRIGREGGDIPYQFSDGSKVKKLYVNMKLHKQLGTGVIAIARLGEGYELVPAVVADKIRQRDESVIVVHNLRSSPGQDDLEDDPYAQYQIPDDLMW